MSPPDVIPVPASPTWEENHRLSLWELIKGVLWGELVGSLLVTLVMVLLTIAHLSTFDGLGDDLYWPWRVDGAWALIADLGWAFLVVTPIAWLVRFSVADRTNSSVSLVWTWVAVAGGGYGAMALSLSSGTQVLAAVVGSACLLRVVAFDSSGAARGWPQQLQLQLLAAGIASLAVFVTASFSLLHPFRVTGSGSGATTIAGSSTRTIHVVKAGETVLQDTGFSLDGLPGQVTDVVPLGAGPGVRVSPAVTARVGDLSIGARGGLPISVPFGHELWVRFRFTLSTCTTRAIPALTGVRLTYRSLGFIGLSQTVWLDRPVAIRCVHRG